MLGVRQRRSQRLGHGRCKAQILSVRAPRGPVDQSSCVLNVQAYPDDLDAATLYSESLMDCVQFFDYPAMRDALPHVVGWVCELAAILGRHSAMVKLNWLRRFRVVKVLFSSVCGSGQERCSDQEQELACFQHRKFEFFLAQRNTF